MRRIFGTFVITLLGGVIAPLAIALEYVECWNENCLLEGWTARGVDRSGFTDFQCREGGCEKAGWIVGGTLGEKYYVSCQGKGCFRDGWFEIDRETQRLLTTVNCRRGDCLVYGWEAYSAAGVAVTECIEQSCRKEGWHTQGPGGVGRSHYCRNGDCFRYGWVQTNRGVQNL